MNVRILQQPFDVNGALCRLGTDITARLASGQFRDVLIFSAFVTSSGTQRLGPALHAITQAGGTVRALIGVRNGLTSAQAVADLHAAGVEVWGLDTGGSVLYHPKVYILRGEGVGWISVGSSNLTGEGLFRNIETNTIIELDLAEVADSAVIDQLMQLWDRFRTAHHQNTRRIRPDNVEQFVTTGVLADELRVAKQNAEQRSRIRSGGRRTATPDVPRMSVPALPAVTNQRPVHRPARHGHPAREEPSSARPTLQTRYFAMTLSAHDASKRTGTRGTPELSLPRSATEFFPGMALAGHEYPDAYFDVRLNSGQQAETVQYRIWERPAGAAVGHADLRINVKHATIDLTTPGGGDIILFELMPEGSGPVYDVWIIAPGDANHPTLLERCTHAVAAQGAAAQKRYGFF
ncbi:MAG: phospholipase D-like domain-containing protein [Terriglobales bacterium]